MFWELASESDLPDWMISVAFNLALEMISAAKVSKKGDSEIGSIHDSGEGSRGEAVKAVVDAFRS